MDRSVTIDKGMDLGVPFERAKSVFIVDFAQHVFDLIIKIRIKKSGLVHGKNYSTLFLYSCLNSLL